jgi:hypothetical protein
MDKFKCGRGGLLDVLARMVAAIRWRGSESTIRMLAASLRGNSRLIVSASRIVATGVAGMTIESF